MIKYETRFPEDGEYMICCTDLLEIVLKGYKNKYEVFVRRQEGEDIWAITEFPFFFLFKNRARKKVVDFLSKMVKKDE